MSQKLPDFGTQLSTRSAPPSKELREQVARRNTEDRPATRWDPCADRIMHAVEAMRLDAEYRARRAVSSEQSPSAGRSTERGLIRPRPKWREESGTSLTAARRVTSPTGESNSTNVLLRGSSTSAEDRPATRDTDTPYPREGLELVVPEEEPADLPPPNYDLMGTNIPPSPWMDRAFTVLCIVAVVLVVILGALHALDLP